MLPENQLPLVAVTTETLLGVATPVMVGVVEPPPDVEPVLPVVEVDDVPSEPPVELVEAVSPEPPQPAIKPAAAAAHAKPRSCLSNSAKLIYNTSRLTTCCDLKGRDRNSTPIAPRGQCARAGEIPERPRLE